MDKSLEQLRQELTELRKTIRVKAREGLDAQLKTLFEENPKLESFSVRVNNHEFNDGDPTYFSIYSEEPDINDVDYYDFYDEDDVTAETLEELGISDKEALELAEKINDIFSSFNGEELEEFYGDAYESIRFTRNGADY